MFSHGFSFDFGRHFGGAPAQVAADMYPYIKEAAVAAVLACDIGLWRKHGFNHQEVVSNYL